MVICDRSACCPWPVVLRWRRAVRAHMTPYMPPVSSRYDQPQPAGGCPGKPDRNVWPDRACARGPHGGVVVVTPGVAKAGHGDVDDVGPELTEILVAQPPLLHHPRTKILHGDG